MKLVSELVKEELDYWVAKSQGLNVEMHELASAFPPGREKVAVVVPDGAENQEEFQSHPYLPSEKNHTHHWAPLLEEYKIWLSTEYGKWIASVTHFDTGQTANIQEADEVQVAICRAIVVYKYGKYVDGI